MNRGTGSGPSAYDTGALAAADKRHLWHPFTQMQDWCAPDHEPVILVEGEGALVRDSRGREYIDGNASIWTNVHGHSHPGIVAAITDQASRLAHASFLGTSNVPAIQLAEALVGLFPDGSLSRVFFTDDGSTAIECALKMELQFRQLIGQGERREFVAFDGAYHGDTIGAASLGGIPAFHSRFQKLGLTVHSVPSIEALHSLPGDVCSRLAGAVIEPLIQGAAGMRLWPEGMLRELRGWCDTNGVHLILDEVMTGFGRTGAMFACEREGVVPDSIALAKGLTGGTMPLAATLTTETVYEAFLGRYEEQKTFYYGHSYTGNPLGCAAALASLRIFDAEKTLDRLPATIGQLGEALEALAADSPHLGEVRQCGMIAGIDLWEDARSKQSFDWKMQMGARVCTAARDFGLLTRPVRDTIVLMPPYCISRDQIATAVEAIGRAVSEVC